MSTFVNIFDTYERRARLYPALLVLLPGALGVTSWLSENGGLGGIVGGAVACAALAAFAGQIARDLGKRREPELFRTWGKAPSVRALSYDAGVFDDQTLRRIHNVLHGLDSNLQFPSNREDELSDPAAADSVYLSASELLLSQTRNRDTFGLVFEENVNYGYRRNLWAMKGAGLVFAVLGVVSCVWKLAMIVVSEAEITITPLIGIAVGVTLGCLWVTRINERWVRTAADAFARQLCLAAQAIGRAK